MNISIIGTGSFGTALGKALVNKHQITFGSRTPEEKSEWAINIGSNVKVVGISEASKHSDVIILALNWFDNTLINAVATFESLENKIIIDASNVLQKDFSPLKFVYSDSGAEEIVRNFPKANVVKAFNTASGHTIETDCYILAK